MSESLSKEALLEYVKKQKQKIKKLEQELNDEKEKTATAPKFSAIPDLAALQDEISGGISSFFGITSAAATTDAPAAQNTVDVTTEDASKTVLATKDAELTSSLLREKKLKALIKVKIKEVDDKEKEVQQYKALLAAEKDDQKPSNVNSATVSSSNELASLQQEIDELKARLQKEQRGNGENGIKSETTAAKAEFDAEGEAEVMQAQLSSYNAYISQLEGTVKSLEAKFELMDLTIREEKEKSNTLSETGLEELTSLRQQITLSSRDNVSLNTEVASLRTEITALERYKHNYEDEKEKSDINEKKSKELLAGEKARFFDLEKELKAVSDELKAMKEKNDREQQENGREKLEIEELRQVIARLEDEKETEAAKAQTLRENEEKRIEKEEKEREKEIMEREKEIKERENEDKKREMEVTLREKEEKKREIERESSTEHYLSEVKEWKLKHDGLVTQLDDLRESHSIEVRDINERNASLLTQIKDDNDVEIERIKSENYTKVQEIKGKVKAKMEEIKDQNTVKVQLLNDLNIKLQEEVRLSAERILSLENRAGDGSASSSTDHQPSQQSVSAVGGALDRNAKTVTSIEMKDKSTEEMDRETEMDRRCEVLEIEVQGLKSLVDTLQKDLQASQTALSDALSSQSEGEKEFKKDGAREGLPESTSSSSSESEIRTLKEDNLIFQNQIQDLRKLQESTLQDLDSKMEELDLLRRKIEEDSDTAATVTAELTLKNTELSRFKGEMEGESSILRVKIAGLEAELSASLDKEQILCDSIAKLRAEVPLIRETVDSLEKESVALRKEGVEKSARIAELEETVRSIGEEIQDLRDFNSSEALQAEESRRARAQAEENATAAVACGAIEIAEREKENQAEREAATATAAALSELRSQLEVSTQTVQEKEALLSALQAEVQEYLQAISERDASILTLKTLLQEEQVRAEGLVESAVALRDAVHTASSETELLRNRLTELQEQPVVPLYDPSRDALDAAITESEEAVTCLKEELKATTEDLGSASSALNLLREKELKIEIEKENLTAEVEKLKAELEVFTAEVEDLRSNKGLLEESSARAVQEISSLSEIIQNLNVSLETASSVAEEKKVEYQREKKKILTDKIKLQNLLKLQKESFDGKTLEIEQEKEKILTEKANIQKEMENLQSGENEKRNSFDTEKEFLLSEKMRLYSEVEKLQSSLSLINSNIISTNSENCNQKNTLISEIENLQAAVDRNKVEKQRGEERMKMLLMENSNFSEKIEAANKDFSVRASDFESELSHARIEREHLRKRVLELEGVIEGIERDGAANAESEVEMKRVSHECKDLTAQLEDERALSADLSLKHTQALSDIRTQKQESEAKIEILSEKCKRLKNLLAKSKLMAQEKEKELELKLTAIGGRPRRFGVQCRVLLPVEGARERGEAEKAMWCLTYEDLAPGLPAQERAGSGSGLRWELEGAVRGWQAEGSSLIGTWPDPLQEQWDRDLRFLKNQLREDNSRIKQELEEVTANFNSYKSRAQTALKRLGVDDKAQRVKGQVDRDQVEELQGTIKDLESEISMLTENLNTERDLVQSHLGELRNWEDKWAEKEEEIAEKLHNNEDIKEKLKSEISSAHSQLSELRSLIEERGQYSHASSAEVNLRIFDEDSHQESQFQRPRAPASTSNTDSVEESVSLREVLEAEQTTQGPGGEGSGSGTGLEEGGAVSEVKDPERKRKAAVGAGVGGGGKLVLLQQAEDEVRGNVLSLRTENSYLTAEINDFRHRMALNDEQIISLKNSIRDLEMSLVREREFNSSTSEVNVEYLVNILRKFLMTHDLSERAKLVTVLCSILHLRGDDAKVIAEKWAVKGGGLVGWLIPKRPQLGSTVSMDDDYPQKGTGPRSDEEYQRGVKEARGDVSTSSQLY